MKYLILVLATGLSVTPLAFCQEDKKTTNDVQTAIDLYKQRVSEGANPTLILKDGEAKLTETQLPAAEFTLPSTAGIYATTGGHWTKPSAAAQEIQALESQIEALKTLNAALEKELANCKPNP